MPAACFSATLSLLLLVSSFAYAQTGSGEQTLQSSDASVGSTVLSGYGNARYQRDGNAGFSTVDLERFVFFVGHRFNRSISLFSELEVEDAKVAGGEDGGEVALEQAYVKFALDSHTYLVAGLFLPRLGILNENHLPPNFNGNERTVVETLVIPSTWRELGVGFYGSLDALQLQYSLGIMNGLSSASFTHGTLIRDGRFEGRNASANNLAVSGSLQLFGGPFTLQVSGYYGGTVGLSRGQADSLRLTSGPFGTPVLLGEADIQYQSGGLTVKALGTGVSIPNAVELNRAYCNNTPSFAYGAYAEIGYDVFETTPALHPAQMIVFARLEKLDLNARIPLNGIQDGTLNQRHLIVGLAYLPIPNIALKADIRMVHTGDQNPALLLNSSPRTLSYQTNNSFLNLGIGFSF
jgi:hypothetical protein